VTFNLISAMPSVNPVNLIRKKRDGGALTREELQALIHGYVDGDVPDYQMSAFLMAVYFSGMTSDESSDFMDLMLHSGQVIDLSTIPGIKVDKHSTGGVGDKVSLVLAPMVAACGVPVPMISGRGLGHTGGTVDKLESIPGFRTTLSIDEYRDVVAEVGLVLISQTEQIAPADKRMYALRDVTATVESIPLIAGSIMSKKLAEGIDALVLDIKTGNGAFMQTHEQAVALANALVAIGNRAGKKTVGFVTDMNQPLGYAVGNWVEVVESVECLKGRNVPDLMEIAYVLGGAMVHLGGKASSIGEGMKLCRAAVWSGRAYEKFMQAVERQGGDVSFIRQPEKFPKPSYVAEIKSPSTGVVQYFDTMKIGMLARELGAGRKKVDDVLDVKAGIMLRKKIGDPVGKDETLAVVLTSRSGIQESIGQEFLSCVRIGGGAVARPKLITTYIDATGTRPWSTPEVF
jgi:pyrimidine-nucleoside phosphorylase